MSVADAIRGGEADGELDDVLAAVRERRKTLARRTVRNLDVGDTIRFTAAVRPTYLIGCEATVEQVNQATVRVAVVERDKLRARRYGHGSFNCPVELIEQVEA